MADEELSSSGGSEELEDDADTEFHHLHSHEDEEEEFDENAEDEEEMDEREELDSESESDMGPGGSSLATGAMPSGEAEDAGQQSSAGAEDNRNSSGEQLETGSRHQRGDGVQAGSGSKGDGGLLDDMAVAQQYSVVQLHPTDGRILTLRSALEPKGRQRMPLIPTDVESARDKEHSEWLEQLSAAASRHSQVEGSRFSLLLHARLVIIATEIRAARLKPQQGLNPIKDQEKAPRGPELPRLVAIGLGTFFQALKSLCKERHSLMVEVAGSLCTMLEGLPKLSFAEQEEELLDSLQDVLGCFVAGDGTGQERALSLKAHMMLAVLRGSVKGVLESALLATRQPELTLPVHQHLSMLEPAPPARKAQFPLTARSVLLRHWPSPVLSSVRGAEQGRREREEGRSAEGGGVYAAMANDGMYLYVHSEAGLVKLSCGKPVHEAQQQRAAEAAGAAGAGAEEVAARRETGDVVKVVAYRTGERGWLVCAGGKLYFRAAGKGFRSVLHILSCETLEEEGELPLGGGEGGEEEGVSGPLMSDGRLLYVLTRHEHFVVKVIDPAASDEPVRSVRLAGPACGLRGGAQQAEGEVLDCDVLACGQNRKGELGHSDCKEELVPTLIPGTCCQRVLKIAAGNETSYFLTEEGKVLCCGLNGSGQLGRATRGGEHRAEIEVMEGLPRGRIVEICCFNGAEHVILLTDEGRLYSCGCNAYGQLGIDHVRRSSLLVLVEPLLHVRVAAVACSYHHSIAVTDQGEAYAFGLNDHGQLGIGSSRHSSGPKPMVLPAGVKVAAASCGQHHSVLLSTDGRVLSCGRNHTGQLGLGTRASADTPQLVEGFGHEKVVLVACGYTHTLALTRSGKVYSFGNNNQGQLGHGNVENVVVPKLVEGLVEHKCLKVSCGAHHSCVLTDSAHVFAFGSNCHGQLGQGDTVERASPVLVPGLDGKGIIDIACGFHHMIALTADTSEPALEDASLLPAPEGGIFCTDGVVLSVYQPPPPKANAVGAKVELEALRACRSFSMETGMHTSDQTSALTFGHEALTFDAASNAYWAMSPGDSLELYGNIGAHVPPHLLACCRESRFPCVSEAFLALPEHMVSEQCSVHDASTGALVTLASIDVLSKHQQSLEDAAPSRWRPWTVDVRPPTFQVMSAVLEHCQASVADVKVQHLAVLCLRLVRVNMAELVRLGAGEEGAGVLEACAGATRELLARVQALLSTGLLAATPVHYECCRVMIDGLLIFFASGSGRVALLLGLLSKLSGEGQSESLGQGEQLLARLLLEAIAESREVAMSLIPTAAAGSEPADREALTLHCEAFRELLLLLVVMLDDEAGVPGSTPQLVSEVAMMLLRGLVGEAVEDASGVIFSTCLHPLLQHVLTKAAAVDSRAALPTAPASSSAAEPPSSYFFSSLLPWAVTCSFMFVSDLAFARVMLQIAVDLAEGIAALSEGEDGARDDADTASKAGEVLVESMHPYEPSEREVYHVSLPGASFLTVEFDSSCDLAEGDVVQVFSDNLCRQPVSAPLSGASLVPFAAPVLVVMGDACCISFESGPASSTGRWGFRCSVKGHASPAAQPSWAGFVRMSALVLAGHCAASIFQGGSGGARISADAEGAASEVKDDPPALKGGLTAEAVGALEGLGAGAEPLGALHELLGARHPVWHRLVLKDEEEGPEKELLQRLREEAGAGSALNTAGGVRQEFTWQARKAAFAVLLADAGCADPATLEFGAAKEMWGLAGGIELAVVHAQQVLKVQMLQEEEEKQAQEGEQEENQKEGEGQGEGGGSVKSDTVDEEDLSRQSFQQVLAEVRAKAVVYIFATRSASKSVGEAWDRALAYLKSGERAGESLGEICRRRALVTGRVDALEGMLRVLRSSGADDGVKSDVLKLLSGQLERSCLVRPSMCEPEPHARLCSAYSAIVDTCARLLPESAQANSSLRKAFLSLLPSLPFEQAMLEMRRVVDCVWDMCTAEREGAQPSERAVCVGEVYSMLREGELDSKPHKLTGRHWTAVRVAQLLEDGRVSVELEAASGEGARGAGAEAQGEGGMVVEREKLERRLEAAGEVQPGERVLFRLEDCVAPALTLESAAQVWVAGSLLSVEDSQAEVLLDGVGGEGVDKVKVAAGALQRFQKAPSGPCVTVSRDLCARAEVTASSSTSMVDKVLDGRLDTYWQSSGSRPHWIDFMLPKAARLQGVLMYINYAKDRSFTPKRVTVKLGPSPDSKDFRQLSEYQIRQGADGWTNVLQPSAAGQVGQCVRITICDNQDSGCNSRVRSVKLVASWAHGESDDTLARRGSRLLADAAQSSLRLLAASLVLSSTRPETEHVLDPLERTCLDCIWESLAGCVRGLAADPDARVCAEWVDFLVAASRTRALRVYLEEPAKHEPLLELLEKGSAALQTKLLSLYAVVLPALVRYPQEAILARILEIAGRALCLSAAHEARQPPVHWSIGVQCVYLLRSLLAAPSWARSVEAVVLEALGAATSLEAIQAHELKLVAALAVFGGLVDGLRVGAKVARVTEDAEAEQELEEGEVVAFDSDCSMLGVRTQVEGKEVVQRVHISTVRVTDGVKYWPNPKLLPAILAVFRAVHREEAAEVLAQQASSQEPLLVQVRCMVARAVCALAGAREAAEACFKSGLLPDLLSAASEHAVWEEARGVQREHVLCAVLERMAHCRSWGEEALAQDKEPAAEPEPASPGEASRQEEARARDAQREAMALDLMALGYGQRLCTVALQLNGDDAQAAATWLLDSSAQYLDNHPELLEQPEDAPASPAVGVEGADPAVEDTVVEQSFFALRSSAAGGGGERQAGSVLRVEEVRAGMVVQVVATPALNRGVEGMFGRCGVVAVVDKETGTASVRWGPKALKGARSVSVVPISALGRPDSVSARTLCFPLALHGGAELLGAAKGLLSRMHAAAIADAVANTVAHAALLPSLVAPPALSPAQTATSKPGGEQGPGQGAVSEAHVSRLLHTVAVVSQRMPVRARTALHQGLATLIGVWERASKGSDETDANIDAGALVRKRVVDECSEQLAKASPSDWVVYDESPHPLSGPLDASARAVRVAGGPEQAVSVLFDCRCHLGGAQRLQLFLDEACTDLVASCGGKGYSTWAPLILPRNTLKLRVTGPAGQGADSVWGFRLAVTPLAVPSVQLSAWATQWFLDCAALSATQLAGLVSHLTDAVVQFALPCPLRLSLARALVALLRRAAANGVLCTREAEVQAALSRVMSVAAAELRARHDKETAQSAQGPPQLSTMTQTMAELLSACAVHVDGGVGSAGGADDAEEGMEGAGEAEEVEGVGELRELVEEMGLESREVAVRLAGAGGLAAEDAVVVASVMADALFDSAPLPGRCDSVLCEAFLADHAPFEVRESAQHPYARGTEEKGVVRIRGAARLRVVMDRRSATDGDDYLTFFGAEDETNKVASYSGTFGTAGGGADTRLVVEGDVLSYTFVGKKASNWGFRFVVRPEYPVPTQLQKLRKNREALEDAVAGMVLCTPEVDAKLVQLVNERCEAGGLSSLASPVRLVLPASSSAAPASSSAAPDAPQPEQQPLPPALSALPPALLRFRLAVLQAFNGLLGRQILGVVDWSLRSLKGSILHTITAKRELLFLDVKTCFMQSALAVHASQADKPVVVVDRRSPKTVFDQLLAQVGRIAPSRLWHPDMAFLVQFLGEGAEGYNGPYRECFSTTCGELESPALSLLVPSPNRLVGGTAPNQDCFVLRPSSRAPYELDMLEFLGRLFGVAVWTKLPLDLHLPPSFWRRLVGQPPAPSDLAEYDVYAHRVLQAMRRAPSSEGKDADADKGKEEVSGLPETFEVLLSDGRSVELGERGAHRRVTPENQAEWAQLALAARQDEAAPQLRAIRKGLDEMLPDGLVELLDGRELERLVTGSAAVDVALLREHTVCRGEEGHEAVVEALWEVLGSLSQEDLAAFLRFVWGRSRLPRPSEFTETFKIHISPPGDNRLPKADTCFFTLNVPAYSSTEILRARLLYAIHHCKDMDADLLEAAIPQVAR